MMMLMESARSYVLATEAETGTLTLLMLLGEAGLLELARCQLRAIVGNAPADIDNAAAIRDERQQGVCSTLCAIKVDIQRLLRFC